MPRQARQPQRWRVARKRDNGFLIKIGTGRFPPELRRIDHQEARHDNCHLLLLYVSHAGRPSPTDVRISATRAAVQAPAGHQPSGARRSRSPGSIATPHHCRATRAAYDWACAISAATGDTSGQPRTSPGCATPPGAATPRPDGGRTALMGLEEMGSRPMEAESGCHGRCPRQGEPAACSPGPQAHQNEATYRRWWIPRGRLEQLLAPIATITECGWRDRGWHSQRRYDQSPDAGRCGRGAGHTRRRGRRSAILIPSLIATKG